MLNYEGTKTPDGTHPLYDEFQYSKNYEGTKTDLKFIFGTLRFQYSKNYEGTKTSKVLYHFLRNDVKIQF